MKSPAPPPAPDPVATANAQANANTKAATVQQMTNMVGQTTPYGSLNYTQDGYWTDAEGKKIAPRFNATTTLSPQEQAKQEQQWEFDRLVNDLGINQTKKLDTLLSSPLDINNETTEARLTELGRKRLDPMLEQRRAALETRLYNQGVMPGSEAYDRAMKADSEAANDAYNQLFLTGRGQAVQEALTERSAPINEITALMSGGQVQQPGFTSTPQAQVAAPDIGGMTYQSYAMGPMAQWQAGNANRLAAMDGIFRLGSAAMGGWAMNRK